MVGYHAVNRVGPIPVLRALERLEQDLRRAAPGQAYFAHLLIPHYPYVLDESCRIREHVGDWLYNVVSHDAPVPNSADSRAERYRRYFAQIRCQQRLLRRLFDALEQAGAWRDAHVIVHGDHGSRIARRLALSEDAGRLAPEDFGDHFSTLFAVRMPGTQAEVSRGPRTLQELLREVLGLPAQRSPALVYLRTRDGGSLIPLPRDTGPAPR
jgi:arylsulfatase A-like enzyme